MRVLVTGAAGYLGSVVITQLAAAGHRPIALVHRNHQRIPVGIETRAADLLDPGTLLPALDGVDSVCHLAALTNARQSLTDPAAYLKVNTVGTINVLDAMTSSGVRGLVFASTAAVAVPAEPPVPYSASKQAAEIAIASFAQAGLVDSLTLRLTNVAGGADSDPTRIIPRVIAATRPGGELIVNGDGSAVRDFLHIDDAAAAFVAAVGQLPSRTGASRYDICSGIGTSINELIAVVTRVVGRPPRVQYGPSVPEPTVLTCDPGPARRDLCWSPERSAIENIVAESWDRGVGPVPDCPRT